MRMTPYSTKKRQGRFSLSFVDIKEVFAEPFQYLYMSKSQAPIFWKLPELQQAMKWELPVALQTGPKLRQRTGFTDIHWFIELCLCFYMFLPSLLDAKACWSNDISYHFLGSKARFCFFSRQKRGGVKLFYNLPYNTSFLNLASISHFHLLPWGFLFQKLMQGYFPWKLLTMTRVRPHLNGLSMAVPFLGGAVWRNLRHYSPQCGLPFRDAGGTSWEHC